MLSPPSAAALLQLATGGADSEILLATDAAGVGALLGGRTVGAVREHMPTTAFVSPLRIGAVSPTLLE